MFTPVYYIHKSVPVKPTVFSRRRLREHRTVISG
jgi:hypothetical protein